MIVKVSSSDIPGVLDNPSVMGQASNYMLAAQSYSGQEDVFAIATTLELPHSDSCAAAATIDATVPPTALDDSVMLAAERALHPSKVCSYRDMD